MLPMRRTLTQASQCIAEIRWKRIARCGAASDWRRPHRFVNGSQAATVRAQVGCFLREARKLLALYESVRASMVRFQGRGDVDGVVRYAGEAPPVMLFTEFLHFVLPQAAYVRRRDGTAACDLAFTMAYVKAAGGPHAFDSSASTKGEEARGGVPRGGRCRNHRASPGGARETRARGPGANGPAR